MDESEILGRREFLGMATGAAAGAAVGSLISSRKLFGAPSSTIAVARGEAAAAVVMALEALGGIGAFVKPSDRVIIKPNASFPNPPSWGCNTSPEVVATVARLCVEAGVRRVLVVDNTLGNPNLCFSRSGIKEAVSRIPNVKLLAPKQEALYREVEIPRGVALRRTKVYREVLEAERLISLPTAKSHSATGVSLELKGLMGLIWARDTLHRDMDLHQASRSGDLHPPHPHDPGCHKGVAHGRAGGPWKSGAVAYCSGRGGSAGGGCVRGDPGRLVRPEAQTQPGQASTGSQSPRSGNP